MRIQIKGSKLWAAGATGRDVCLARAAVFRDLTPFASAVQTHNHIWTKQKLSPPPPLSTLDPATAMASCIPVPGRYKVHLLVFSRPSTPNA